MTKEDFSVVRVNNFTPRHDEIDVPESVVWCVDFVNVCCACEEATVAVPRQYFQEDSKDSQRRTLWMETI